MTERRMTLDDFMTGLLASLAVHGVRAVSLRGTAFHTSVVRAFRSLDEWSGQDAPELGFWITLNEVYQDSADVREATLRAMHRGLACVDWPDNETLRILVSEPESHLYLGRLPGGQAAHQRAVDTFLESYGACPVR